MNKTQTPASKPKIPRAIKTVIPLAAGKEILIYAGRKVFDALSEISKDQSFYQGVRLSQVLEAAYEQGKKDGARGVFEQVDGLKDRIVHRNPGAPKKTKKRARKRK
jgi:hypothetical protein